MTAPVSIKGVLLIEGEVVLLKNEREEWELPGGRMEPGETHGEMGHVRFLTLLFLLLSSTALAQTSCPVHGEKIHWIADWCMSTMETDDEIVAGACINEELKQSFRNDCVAKQSYKRRLCELAARRGTLAGNVEGCVADPAFMGPTVGNGGVGAYVPDLLPLETKVVHLVNELRAKYRPDPQRLKTFEQAHDAWNAYRNGQCTAESAGGGKAAFARCTRRVLELRVKELEALE